MILWFVDDVVIKVFMNVFYRGLMRDNKSVSEVFYLFVEKLRKLDVYNYFRYWVVFVFFGDDVKFD